MIFGTKSKILASLIFLESLIPYSSIKDKVFLSVKDGFCVCENCRKQGEGSFSFQTYEYLKGILSGNLSKENDELANNGLKFFGYYFSKTTGINLKSLSVLTDLAVV